MTRQEIFHAINMERMRQNGLHPIWFGHEHGLVVLAEEFGEVAKALYELQHGLDSTEDYEGWGKRFRNLQDELIQVAAVCVRWLENVD